MNFIKTKFFFSFVFLVSALLALGAVYWVGTQNDLKAIQEYSPKKENKISKNLMRVDSPNRRKIGKRSTLKMEGQMINKLV